MPLHSSAWVRALNGHLLRFSVRLAARRMGLRAPVLWGYVPQAEVLLDAVDPELVVYHCVDDIAAQEGIDVDSFNAAERRFAARADLVIASSPALAERMRTLSSHVLYAPNVADTDLFATALDPGPVDPRLSVLPEPRIVFVGAIAAKKLDLELLAGLADARRDWTFALVGPVGLGDPDTDVSALAARPNVHLLGARAQTALPDVLRGAAVGLIPYRTSRLTESIFPMKVYEYLGGRAPGGRHRAAGARGRRRGRAGRGGRGRAGRGAACARRRLARAPASPQRGCPRPLVGHPARRDRSGAGAMSDLVVTSMTPTLASGPGRRTYGVVAALARDHPVEVAYVIWGAEQPAAEYRQLQNVTLRALRATRGPARMLEFARARARRVPAGLARGVSPALAAAARAAPADVRVIADGPVVAAGLLGLARTRDVVYLAHNLESGGFRRESERAGLERFERVVLRGYSESWMATRADERGARLLGGDRIRTRYVPNVVDVATVEPVSPTAAGRLLFVGDFTYEPNAEALRFLVDGVLPAVWERIPGARLTAVGRGSDRVGIPLDPRIDAPGFVEDLDAAYRAADVVLVPLLRGGGSPLKFVEGLAHGLPVVATAHAARLLEDGVPGRDFLAAEDATEFAAAIESLLADPAAAAAIGAAGRDLVVGRYSVDRLATLVGPMTDPGSI